MNLRNISIAFRTAFGFGLIALLVVFLGVFSLSRMSEMRQSSLDINASWLPSILTLNSMNEDIRRIREYTLRTLIVKDPDIIKHNKETIAAVKSSLEKSKITYQPLITSHEERELYEKYKAAEDQYMDEQTKVMKLFDAGALAEANALVVGLNAYADQMNEFMTQLCKLNSAGADRATEYSSAVFKSAWFWVIATLITVCGMTVLMAWRMTISIVRPLNRALKTAETVAEGDLTETIDVDGKDEVSRLLSSFQVMQEKLRTTIQGITDSASQLASAAEELNVVTEDSTRGLHQQNGEIEMAATAVNEMTVAVEEVARNAGVTSQASKDANQTTHRGREQVAQTVASITSLAADVTSTAGQIEELADHVRNISQVLDVIRSIADQTNLLALNAAIEAARAGEAGRGFAVVADEVRALAHRTQQSTQEIEQMIDGIRNGTDQAVNAMQTNNQRAHTTLEVAHEAGRALEQIAVSISEINERNLVIASASEEQAQVSREVDRNLTNIRDLSLQSSAGANQTSSASQELSRLAVDLNTMMAKFKV